MPWIYDQDQKQAVILATLRGLPDWFGIPEAIESYGKEGRDLPCYVHMEAGEPVGFVSLKQTSECAAEVHCMAVRAAYHRKGAGRRMIEACEAYCRERGLPILHVKTLDNKVGDECYLKTYAFYRAMGFLPLEVLPLWDERNPCLLLVKMMA